MDNFNTLQIRQVWRTKRSLEAAVRVDGIDYDFRQVFDDLFFGECEVRRWGGAVVGLLATLIIVKKRFIGCA